MTRRKWSELAAAIKHELAVWDDLERTTKDPLKVVEARTAMFAIKQTAYRLAGVLERQHARFDAVKFLDECGCGWFEHKASS